MLQLLRQRRHDRLRLPVKTGVCPLFSPHLLLHGAPVDAKASGGGAIAAQALELAPAVPGIGFGKRERTVQKSRQLRIGSRRVGQRLSGVSPRKEDGPRGLLQLADVSGPRIALGQIAAERFFDALDESGVRFADKTPDGFAKEKPQFAGIFGEALPQRGKLEAAGRQAVVEIVAEASVGAPLGEILVRCGNDAPAEALGLVSADGRKDALLEHTEKFGLHRHGDVSDFIEENGSMAAASGKGALVVANGAGKRSLAMAEELGLDETLCEFREVDGEEGVQEAFGEGAAGRKIGDVPGAAESGGGGALTGAGFAEKEGGKVLHAVPEAVQVEMRVASENGVPEVDAQGAHGGTDSQEAVADEVEGAPKLEEDGDALLGLLAGEPGGEEFVEHRGGTGRGQRPAGRLALGEYVPVKFPPVTMEDLEEEGDGHETRVVRREFPDVQRRASGETAEFRIEFGEEGFQKGVGAIGGG